ncbi:MAG: peptide deformylase [Bacteroidetes bacterium]|nr:MAG: peptide deformylase [Bacteroidota bacterium]
MILPIVGYGNPVLKKKAGEIDASYPGLEKLLEDMWETMYTASGVGLAAPQVGKPIRLFIVDASPFEDEEEELKDFKKVFINAQMLEETGEEWFFNEGCLSFPELREDVLRKPKIRIKYQDEKFNTFEEEYDGVAARIIQHEYDHIEGIVFVDRITPLKRRLIKSKLTNIIKGVTQPAYKMKFAQKK